MSTTLYTEFLALWDDPPEFAQIVFDKCENRECILTIVIEAPGCPILEVKVPNFVLGAA